MSDLCSQLAPCLLLLHHLFRLLLHQLRALERPFDYVSDDDDDKKGKSKVSRVCIRRGFLLIFVFCIRLRCSLLVVFCLAFVSYFLGWFRPKYLAVCIHQCGYCLLLLLLFFASYCFCYFCCLLVSASADHFLITAEPDRLHVIVLFRFVVSGI